MSIQLASKSYVDDLTNLEGTREFFGFMSSDKVLGTYRGYINIPNMFKYTITSYTIKISSNNEWVRVSDISINTENNAVILSTANANYVRNQYRASITLKKK